ncbi:MAG TPA: non-histone chromosomal MC1 family protein [Methanothrix sp.]|nr:non-histone chromosomal MC1 family protein [Methanothrix sp.]HOL44683.1 non-histone chromosomal MC1 family protein [Methanothrix sp.]
MTWKRYYVLLDDSYNDTNHVFHVTYPRQAALKAARRGYTKIYLRQRGTNKVHLYEGRRWKEVKKEGMPDFLPNEIWCAAVRKLGVIKIE